MVFGNLEYACMRASKALFELSACTCMRSVADRLCLRLNPLKGVQPCT